MFVLQFETPPPAPSSGSSPPVPPYYVLIARRDPYLVGRLDNCDVQLDAPDVSRQHIKLEVMRASEAARLDADASHTTADATSKAPTGNALSLASAVARIPQGVVHFDDDPLVLRLTNLSKYGTYVCPPPAACVGSQSPDRGERTPPRGVVQGTSDDTKVLLLSTGFVHDGWLVCIGGRVVLRVSFRQVIVSVAREYAPEYVDELESIYTVLGATCTRGLGPIALSKRRQGLEALANSGDKHKQQSHDWRAKAIASTYSSGASSPGSRNAASSAPLLLAHVSEVVSDDSWSLLALASGYSIVQPAYILEFYGALAASCRVLLHELPPPVQYEPTKKLETYGSASYRRPEPDLCPFTLFPMPSVVGQRSRAELLSLKLFFAPTDITSLRNRAAIECCNGVVASALHDVIQYSRAAKRTSMYRSVPVDDAYRFAAHYSMYVLVEEALADAVRRTSITDLEVFSEERKRMSHRTAEHQHDERHDDDELPNASFGNESIAGLPATWSAPVMCSTPDGDDYDDDGFADRVAAQRRRVEAEELRETQMKWLVKLYLLGQKYGWYVVTERSLHVSLLTNTFAPEYVTFAPKHTNIVEYDRTSDTIADGGVSTGQETRGRDALIAHHDAEVYNSILHSKSAQLLPASVVQLPESFRATGNVEASALTSPLPRRPPTGNGAAPGACNDSDRTPSDLGSQAACSEDDDDVVGGDVGAPEYRGFGAVDLQRLQDRSSHFFVNVEQQHSPHVHSNSTRNAETTSALRSSAPLGGRAAQSAAPPTTAFEARVEQVNRAVRRLLNPAQLSQIEGIEATVRQHSILTPTDAAFARSILQIAQGQLAVLEELHIESGGDQTNTLHASPPATGATRSHALSGLWEKCAGVQKQCLRILGEAGSSVATHAGAHAFEQLLSHDQQSFVSGGAKTDTLSPSRLSSRRHHDPKQNAPSRGGVRPGTAHIRFPPPIAGFLGSNQNHRGRMTLSDEHMLTKRLLATVQPANLPGIAEKRRLFLKRYGVEEGEKRFALWMQSNGAKWTLEMYRTLDSKNLAVMEMLQYE